jgi:uncharacterized protein YciI
MLCGPWRRTIRENFAATMTDEERAAFAAHADWLQRLAADSILILAGPTLGPVNTGIGIFEALDEAAARRVIAVERHVPWCVWVNAVLRIRRAATVDGAQLASATLFCRAARPAGVRTVAVRTCLVAAVPLTTGLAAVAAAPAPPAPPSPKRPARRRSGDPLCTVIEIASAGLALLTAGLSRRAGDRAAGRPRPTPGPVAPAPRGSRAAR